MNWQPIAEAPQHTPLFITDGINSCYAEREGDDWFETSGPNWVTTPTGRQRVGFVPIRFAEVEAA